MSRRRPRISECESIQDFVRAGILRPVQPTTASGFIAYGTGLRALASGHADNTASATTNVQYACGDGDVLDATAGTIAVRCIPGWAGNDSAHHGLLVGRLDATSSRINIIKSSANTWQLLLNNTATAVSASQSFAANTQHVLVARWSTTTADLNNDGTDITQVDHAVATTQPNYFSVGDWYGIAGREWNGYVGPLIISPERKADAWVTAIQADSGAAHQSIPRLVRDFLSVGDFIAPYIGNSTAYKRVK